MRWRDEWKNGEEMGHRREYALTRRMRRGEGVCIFVSGETFHMGGSLLLVHPFSLHFLSASDAPPPIKFTSLPKTHTYVSSFFFCPLISLGSLCKLGEKKEVLPRLER
ncbi:hypothetical protein HOY82DRAFT_409726 [Tuber indicum]|nr:hypothetical protein HOY82DRAFT_409726 [Tuber indicum]